MKHTISIKVHNHAGVMSHVSGLFTRRGFNIDSIAVGVTENPAVSVITIVVKEDEARLRQIILQIRKLVDVIDVKDLPYNESVTRELALIKVKVHPHERHEIIGIVDVFNGKVPEITEQTMLIEISGNTRQIKGIMSLLKEYGILEVVRTGQIAIPYD